MIFFLKFVNLELMKAVDDVLKLYSMGGTGETVVQEWGAVEKEFIRNLEVLRYADANKGAYHRGHYVAVALHVPGPGPDGVPAVTVRIFCALIDGVPISVRPSVAPGVIVAYFLKGLPPCFTLRSGLRVKPSYQPI